MILTNGHKLRFLVNSRTLRGNPRHHEKHPMDNQAKLQSLKARAIENQCSLAVMNAVQDAPAYTGILDVVVRAGSLQTLAEELGVTYQAIQQWLKVGFVPLSRIAEIQTYYGVPRTELMNPKYLEALAVPNFTSDV